MGSGKKSEGKKAKAAASLEVRTGKQAQITFAAGAEAGSGGAGQSAAGQSAAATPSAPPATPSAPPNLNLKTFLQSVKSRVADQVRLDRGEISEQLKRGDGWIRPRVPMMCPPTEGPAPYCRPEVFVWAPHLMGFEIRCPYCPDGGQVVRAGWADELRPVIGLKRPFFLLSSSHRCTREHGNIPEAKAKKAKRFLASKARIILSLPIHAQLTFPAFLCKKLALSIEVRDLMVSARVKHATLPGFGEMLRRSWAHEFARNRTSFVSVVQATLESGVAHHLEMQLTQFSERFSFTYDDFHCGVTLPTDDAFNEVSITHTIINRGPAMARLQHGLPTGEHVSNDGSHKFTKMTPYNGLHLIFSNSYRVVLEGHLMYTQRFDEMDHVFRDFQERLAQRGETLTTFATDLASQQNHIDWFNQESVDHRARLLRGLGYAVRSELPLLTLPECGDGPSFSYLTTEPMINSVCSGLSFALHHIARSGGKPVVGLDAEWNIGDNAAATLQLSVANQPVYVLHLAKLGLNHAGTSLERNMPYALRQLLTSGDILLVGKQLQGDLSKLAGRFGNFSADDVHGRCVELGRFAQDRLTDRVIPRATIGVSALVETIFGKYLPKDLRGTTNWNATLNIDAQKYAALDAYAHRILFEHLDTLPAAASAYKVGEQIPAGTFVDILLENKNIVALGIIEEPPEGHRWCDHDFNARFYCFVRVLTCYRPDAPVHGLPGQATIQELPCVMWKITRTRPTIHHLPFDNDVAAAAGLPVAQIALESPLPLSCRWRMLEGHARVGTLDSGDCFVDSLLWLLNKPLNFPIGSHDSAGSSTRTYRQARAGERRNECRRVREIRAAASPVHGGENNLDDALGCQAICHFLTVRVVVLRAVQHTELMKVMHSVVQYGPDDAPLIGVVFHSGKRDSHHFEPVNLFEGEFTDSEILDLVDDMQTPVIQPVLPSTDAERRRVALMGYAVENGDSVEQGENVGLHNASLIQLDGLHALKNVSKEVSKTHALAVPFCQRLRDAVYVAIPEYEEQFFAAETELAGGEELSSKRKMMLRETSDFRSTVPRTIPPKDVLRANIEAVMSQFRGQKDVAGELLITDRVEDAIRRLFIDVDAGRLSDPPGIFMYAKAGIHARTKMIIWRCLRGTNALENLHLHLYNYVKGMTNMGARLTIALLMEFLFRWNMRSCFRFYTFEDIGTTDIFEFEAMVRITREIRDKLNLGDEFGGDFSWYPLVDQLPDHGPFVVTPLPSDGSFAVLDPVRRNADRICQDRALNQTERVLAKFQGLPMPLSDVETQSEREFFAAEHGKYLSNANALDGERFAADWNERVVKEPSLGLFPKLACMLEAHLPVFQRNSSIRASRATLEDEVDMAALVENMGSDYTGPSGKEELHLLLGDYVSSPASDSASTSGKLELTTEPVVQSVVPALEISSIQPLDRALLQFPAATSQNKRKHHQRTGDGKRRVRAPRRCPMCRREDCPAPSLQGEYTTKCKYVDDWEYESIEAARAALKKRRRKSSGCTRCSLPDCRGGTVGHACDYNS